MKVCGTANRPSDHCRERGQFLNIDVLFYRFRDLDDDIETAGWRVQDERVPRNAARSRLFVRLRNLQGLPERRIHAQ